MSAAYRTLSLLALAALLVAPASSVWAALDPEDQRLIDEASCEDIQREYRNYAAAEREVEAEIKPPAAQALAMQAALRKLKRR